MIVGAGLVGLATARALLQRRPAPAVIVLEKESAPGQHQSTHNSGVLHAGLYYRPGTARARLAVRGIRLMRQYCDDHGVPYVICGKLVVAVTEAERPRLAELLARGTANGLAGLRLLSPAEAREFEPHARCVEAVRVPDEGIVSFAGVVAALRDEIERLGAEVRTGAEVREIRRDASGWTLGTGRGDVSAGTLVNCAGLYADRIAELAGEQPPCRIVPFRGEYYELGPAAAGLVRGLIYPVPDPAFPFLGVHLTRMISGIVEAGPNAVLALAREGYTRWVVKGRDLVESLQWPGLWRFVAQHPRAATYEVLRSISRTLFARSLRRLVPEIRESDLLPGPAGVRAQAMSRDGRLVDDFLFLRSPGAVHVLNAPSPAATASLAIGEEIAALVS